MNTRISSPTVAARELLRRRQPQGHLPESLEDLPTTEAHWDELHGDNGAARQFLSRAGQRLGGKTTLEMLAAAAAGFALGWLVFSQRRSSQTMRDLVIGSLLPMASKGVHDAYDTVRSPKTWKSLGRRAAQLRSSW